MREVMQVDSELLLECFLLSECHTCVGQDLTFLVMRVSAEELRFKVAMQLACPLFKTIPFNLALRALGCSSHQILA